jgi:hypothetical protein
MKACRMTAGNRASLIRRSTMRRSRSISSSSTRRRRKRTCPTWLDVGPWRPQPVGAFVVIYTITTLCIWVGFDHYSPASYVESASMRSVLGNAPPRISARRYGDQAPSQRPERGPRFRAMITSTLSLGELRSERADCCSTHRMKGPPGLGRSVRAPDAIRRGAKITGICTDSPFCLNPVVRAAAALGAILIGTLDGQPRTQT